MDEAILSKVHPTIEPYVNCMMSSEETGLCQVKLWVDDIDSGANFKITSSGESHGDRFKVTFTIAFQKITWEIIMNYCEVDCPPDFIFDDSMFLSFLMNQPLKEKLPSLANWNKDDKMALLNVIKELLSLYREYQISFLKDSSRIAFEYSSLEEIQVPEDCVEVFQNRSNPNGPIYFLIKLPIDFTKLSDYVGQDEADLKKEFALLMVRFNSPDVTQITTQISLSPIIENEFESISKVPKFPKASCLMDYIPIVLEHFESNIEFIEDSFKTRQICVKAFVTHFENCVIEYDTRFYTRMSFLFEWNDFFFLFHIFLSKKFPKARPAVQFQSVFHMYHGRPYTCKYETNFPYSPEDTPEEFIENTIDFINNTIPTFQRNSLRCEN